MIPSKLKVFIDQYLGIQPSEEEMSKIMSKVESYGLSTSDQVEVLEYMDRVFNTSQAEIEAMRKLQEADVRANKVNSEVEAMERKSRLIKEERKRAEYHTKEEQEADARYKRELQKKKFTMGKFLKDFGYGYCVVFVVVFVLTAWGSLSFGNGVGSTLIMSVILALMVSVVVRFMINDIKKS